MASLCDVTAQNLTQVVDLMRRVRGENVELRRNFESVSSQLLLCCSTLAAATQSSIPCHLLCLCAAERPASPVRAILQAAARPL